MTVLDWVLDSDPSIRWQVMRDLADAPAEVVAAERARVATEGWGSRLLALRGEDGQMGGRRALPRERMVPRHFTMEEGDGRPSPWNTLRALRVLSWFGHPAERPARKARL